jgi:hypothetical protein
VRKKASTPAKAGVQFLFVFWIPAYAGMTDFGHKEWLRVSILGFEIHI